MSFTGQNLLRSLGAVALLALSSVSARASFVVDIDQVGNNVVATGSGSIDTAGLVYEGHPPSTVSSGISPIEAIANLGIIPTAATDIAAFYGIVGPTPDEFGTTLDDFATSSTGTFLLLQGQGLDLPTSYVSGTQISDSDTFDNITLADLGLTPDTSYVWTWGYGNNADSLTIDIETPQSSPVPEPGTFTMLLIGMTGLAGLLICRRTQLSAR